MGVGELVMRRGCWCVLGKAALNCLGMSVQTPTHPSKPNQPYQHPTNGTRGMLPTSLSDMLWLRAQIRCTIDSVREALTADSPPVFTDGDADGDDQQSTSSQSFKPDLIISNQLAYGQVRCLWLCWRNLTSAVLAPKTI